MTKAVQKPSDTPLVIYAPCTPQASTRSNCGPCRPANAVPGRLLPTMGGLQLPGLHHREAASRLGAEGHDEVAGFGHPVPGARG